MNEARRKPTTGRQSPTLFDKWHEAVILFLFNLIQFLLFQLLSQHVPPLDRTTYNDESRRADNKEHVPFEPSQDTAFQSDEPRSVTSTDFGVQVCCCCQSTEKTDAATQTDLPGHSEMANLQDDMYQKKAEIGIQADVEDYMCQRKADESKLLLTEHAYSTRPPLELPMHATIATPGMSTTGDIPSTSSPVKDYPPFRFQLTVDSYSY